MIDTQPELQLGRSAIAGEAIEHARAQEYALLGVLLAKAPDGDLLARLATLEADDTLLGTAHGALAAAAANVHHDKIEREFFDLFIGVGRGEILPYGSYYLAGALHDRPLSRLRRDLKRLGIARAQAYGEPEDHAAVLCEIMASLIDRRFDTPAGADRDMFENHLAPWMDRFFADLERAPAAHFYRCVGMVGRCFIGIEGKAFKFAA